MLDPEYFYYKYNTKYRQTQEEDFLKELSAEELEMYAPVEILTGRNHPSGMFNKFNVFGKGNRGKTYDTTDLRLRNMWKRFVDSKDETELNAIFEKIWSCSKEGDFKFSKFLMEKLYGKEEEKVNVKVENISFEIDNKKIIDTEKEKKDE